jgi:transposase-like protein
MIRLKNNGRSATSLSKEYNVSVSTICKWIQQDDPNNTNVLSIKERELIKENKRLKEENDILKRAAVLLAKN